MQQSIHLFSGSSHPELAKSIADELGISLRELQISRFACGEVYARPKETVRGNDVFVIQTTTNRVNEDLMELFVILDSLKRSFANRVHVVMPFYAYSRQDRVSEPREPISAKLVADLLSTAGADHVITMNLHSGQEQGFFDYPVDNLNARKLFVETFRKKNIENLVVVSPDAGGAKEAKKLSDEIGSGRVAFIHKHRMTHNNSEALDVVGDVKDAVCIIYDDMIDTGGSVCNAKKVLERAGAKAEMYLVATHAVFSDPAPKKLAEAGFSEVIVTDTVPIPESKKFKGLTIISTAPLLAKIIRNVQHDRSITSLY